ncbi:MAG: HPF/RaiA family ribosome-associated protein [Dokdonella sp.]
MNIQINTDKNIQYDESLTNHVNSTFKHALERFGTQITRIEIHLSDVNAAKPGVGDKRCLAEARLEGRKPVAVSNDADSVREAVNGAAQKLQRLLDSSLGRLASQERQAQAPSPMSADEALDPDVDAG